MRLSVVCACVVALSTPVLAEEEGAVEKCERVGQVVQSAVDARINGDSQRKTRRMLVKEMDKDAGTELADLIYSLPDEFLNEDVAAAFQAQCEQL